MSEGTAPIYRPKPTRPFIIGESFDSSPNDTPANELLNPLTGQDITQPGATTPSELSKRSQSIRNLTSSALFGIYGPSAYDSTPGTPGATRRSSSTNLASNPSTSPTSPISPDTTDFSGSDGSSLPSQRSRPLSNLTPANKRRRKKTSLVSQLGSLAVLFVSGAGYGLIIDRLHDQGSIAPVKVEVDRHTPLYYIFWGVAAVVLGRILPWADETWEEYVWESGGPAHSEANGRAGGEKTSETRGTGAGDVWNSAIRSVGAFVGIAYGIRKLPWESTSQASLTLASINPVLWYLLDRTRTGFWLSTIVAIVGSIFLIGFNPDFVAIPGNRTGLSIIEKLKLSTGESHQVHFIGAVSWIASVLYVSTLCFGNIGRKLSGRREGAV